jgi:uncharacterized protein YerC
MKSPLSLTKALCAVIARKRPPEVFSYLEELFTEKELELAEKRLRIAVLLDGGLPYSQIQKELKVSAATIAMVAEMKQRENFAKLMSQIERELARFRWLKERLNYRRR